MLIINDRVIEIDNNGYLEQYELENKLMHSLSRFYSDAIELNNNVCLLYDQMSPSSGDGLATFYLGTLERMHKDYQAVLILLCRGMQSQARSIMRNLLEKTLIIKAVDKKQENLKSWVRTQNRERNRTKETIKSGITHFTEEELVAMDLEESKDIEKVSYSEWAKRAGMEFDYKVIYHIFCGDTHHTMSGMDKDAVADDNRFSGFSIAPNFEDIDYIITLAMHYLLMTVAIIAEHLKIDVEWIVPLQEKLDALGFINLEKYGDSPSPEN